MRADLSRKRLMGYTSARGGKHLKEERKKKMKVKITVEMENTDGTSAVERTTIDVDVPDFEEFTGPDRFGAVFDKYERKVLKARNEVIEAATEKYLSEMAKKKHSQSQGREKEK
jgi:hypothetical protein